MKELICSKQVDAPIDVVFDAFSDFTKAAERVDGIVSIEMLTDGDIGVGTRFKETRIMFGKETTEEMEVSQFSKNESLTVAADTCGSHFETVYRFQPNGDQTKVDVEMSIQPTSITAKLMSPLGFLMNGSMKKIMNTDFDQIKEHCESKA